MSTRPGFLLGEEVVEVEYDPRRIDYAQLLELAVERDCATIVATRDSEQHGLATARVGERAVRTDEAVRADGEPHYYLLKSKLSALPLTEAQATRVNASLEGDWRRWLSPRQLEQAEALLEGRSLPEAPGRDGPAWPVPATARPAG